MTNEKIDWKEQKARLKEKFGIQTNNDMMFAEGKKEEILEKLEVKLGKTKEELHRIIAAL